MIERPKPVAVSLIGITRDPITFYRPREANAYMDALEAENRELREAIETHRRNVWGPGNDVMHPEDSQLYRVLGEAKHD